MTRIYDSYIKHNHEELRNQAADQTTDFMLSEKFKSIFHQAIEDNSKRRLRDIQEGISRLPTKSDHLVKAINYKDLDGRTPLYLAVQKGNDLGAKILLQIGADSNIKCPQETALFLAVEMKSLEMVRFLLEHNETDINIRTFGNNTIFHVAMEHYEQEIVNILMRSNACSLLDVANDKGQTPLHIAARKANHQLMKFLLDRGATIKKDSNGLKPIDYIEKDYLDEKVIDLMITCDPADKEKLEKLKESIPVSLCTKIVNSLTSEKGIQAVTLAFDVVKSVMPK